MNELQPLQESLYWFYGDFIRSFSIFLPRIIAALLILIFGAAIARFLRKVLVRLLESLQISKLVKDTPVDHFLKKAELKTIENVSGGALYWLVMLVVLHSTVAVLGLEPLTVILERLLSYLPRVFSSVLILFIGILLAGLVETVVKATIKSMSGKSARMLGKVSSYLVMVIVVMAAVSELGIASDFILILFVGLISTLTLGVGLALGLGGQDLVKQLLKDWYEGVKKK